MPSPNESPPLMRKSYLVVLALAALVLLLTSGGREALGYLVPKGCQQRTSQAGDAQPGTAPTPRLGDDIAAIRRDVETFNAWFNDKNAPTAVIDIIRHPVRIERLDPNPSNATTLRFSVVVQKALRAYELGPRLHLQCDPRVSGVLREVPEPVGGTNFTVTVERVAGVGRLGLGVDKVDPKYYDVNVRSLWPVPIKGTMLSAAGWRAAVGSIVLATTAPNNVISPRDDKCGYQIVSVSRRCVWFAAFFGDEPEVNLPALNWPDLEGVRTSLDAKRVPERVELRKGTYVRPGDTIVFPRTRARMVVDGLWPQAVHFRYQPSDGGKVLDLLCVVVR